jgi:pimeloyl-ACP methyl ester carboxylesterase
MHGATLRFLRQYFRPNPGIVEVSETTFARGNEMLPASIYRRHNRRTYKTAWVVLHGITYRGRQHKSLQRFASSMAAAGHFVFIPEIPEWSRFQVAPSVAVPTIRAAVHALQSRDDIDRERVGLFAFSFGGTHAIVAASDPSIQRELKGVVSWGGYESVHRLVQFGLTGEHELDGNRYQVEPDPYGRWVVGGNYLTRISGFEDMSDVADALLELATEAGSRGIYAGDPVYEPVKHELAARFTGEKLRVFDVFAPRGRILGSDRSYAREIAKPFADVIVKHDPLMDPTDAFARIRVRTFLAHGRDDRLIPFTETLRAGRRISPDVLAGSAITGLFAHSGGTSGNLSSVGKMREGALFLSTLDRALSLI